jgi:hypothetical protein
MLIAILAAAMIGERKASYQPSRPLAGATTSELLGRVVCFLMIESIIFTDHNHNFFS